MREGMTLSRNNAIVVCAWNLAIFSLGLGGLYSCVSTSSFYDEVTLKDAALCSVCGALSANSLFYMRRLYKDIFVAGLRQEGEKISASEFATFVYFLSRPLFAILFSSVAVLTAAAFIHATTFDGARLSLGFVFVTTILSVYGATITGSTIRQFEKAAVEKLQQFGREM